MIALIVVVAAVGVTLGVIYPFVSVILADFGFSPAEIGLITSLGSVGFALSVPAWGHLADVRFGRPRTLQLCAVGSAVIIGMLLLPVPLAFVVVAFVAFPVFESSWQPLADALTVNAVRGRDYARIRTITSLGFAVAAIVAGRIYDATGFDAAFALFVGGCLVMAGAAGFVPDVERAALTETTPADRGRRSWRPSLGSSGVALRVAPRLGLVLVAAALLHVGIISGFTFLPLRIVDLGGQPSDVALAAGLSAAAEIPTMLVIGAVASRVGLRAVFASSALLYAACIASWAVLDTPMAIVATRVVTGIAFSGVVVGVVLTIAVLLPRDLQATGQALVQTVAFGIAAIIANVVGGVLYQVSGATALFGVGAVLAVVAAIVGWVAFPVRIPSDGRAAATG